MGEGTAKLGEVQEGFGEYPSSCGVAQNKFCCLRPKGGTPAFQRPGAGGKRPQGRERAKVGTPPSPPLGQASSSFQLRALFPTGVTSGPPASAGDCAGDHLGKTFAGRPNPVWSRRRPYVVLAWALRLWTQGTACSSSSHVTFLVDSKG